MVAYETHRSYEPVLPVLRRKARIMKRHARMTWGELMKIVLLSEKPSDLPMVTIFMSDSGICKVPPKDTAVELTWDEPERKPHQCPKMKEVGLEYVPYAGTGWMEKTVTAGYSRHLLSQHPHCEYCGKRLGS